MPISTVLLICTFLLCCTGTAEKPCNWLHVPTGSVAALTLVTAALSAFDHAPSAHIGVQPAVVLLTACGVLLNLHYRGLAYAVLAAAGCGIAAWTLRCAFPSFYEPGVLLALPAALTGRFLLRDARCGLLCVLLTPLFFGLIVTFEDWYLFDFVRFSLGNALQLDMQVAGATLYALLMYIARPMHVLRRPLHTTALPGAQKEA